MNYERLGISFDLDGDEFEQYTRLKEAVSDTTFHLEEDKKNNLFEQVKESLL